MVSRGGGETRRPAGISRAPGEQPAAFVRAAADDERPGLRRREGEAQTARQPAARPAPRRENLDGVRRGKWPAAPPEPGGDVGLQRLVVEAAAMAGDVMASRSGDIMVSR